MIQANELRLGNYVIDNVTGEKGPITQLCNFDNDIYTGIQLTPKILSKLGARQLHHGWFIGKLKFTYEHNELSQFVRFHYSGKITYIQYVHQLQNIVHALTQTELTLTL